MEQIKLLARNGEAVRQAIERGELLHLDTASEELTDEFLLFAIESGLLKLWADSFPDPRSWAEISMEVILATQMAARFSGLYSQRKSRYVLRSARVLGALGYSLEVLNEGEGISGRGTKDDSLMSQDVLRKLLGLIEKRAEVTDADLEAARVGGALVEVKKRASRRAVKQQLDTQIASARSAACSRKLIAWYNQSVGPALLDYADMGEGRRIHLLDTTQIVVALSTGTYECSGVVKDEEGQLWRGYKLATLRSLLDTAGLLTQVAITQIQVHDVKICRELIEESRVLRAGDLLIEDRGLIDGGLITYLKRERGVDSIVPLRSDMLSYQEAVRLAEVEGRWQSHPSRRGEHIAFVGGVEHVWDECQVKLNACVIGFYNNKKQVQDYIVIVTTDLSLSASWIVKHYQQRPEIEADYQQLKSGGWMIEKLSSTRYSQIVLYVLTVVLSYSLYQLFANTAAGRRFAHKTRSAIALEQIRTHRTHVIAYAGGYFEIFETLSFVHLVLSLAPEVQARLRHWLEDNLPNFQRRE